MMIQRYFPHEKHKAYQLALEWAQWVCQYIEKTEANSPMKMRLLELANTIPVNIAEGMTSTRSTHHDRLETARDSVIASAAVLDVIDLTQKLDPERMIEAKRHLNLIIRQLTSIIQAANTADAIRNKLATP